MEEITNMTMDMLKIFATDREKPLLDLMAIVMIVTGLVTYIALQVIPAPYGRYSNTNFGPLISSRLAWIIQECPSFFVPVFVWLTTKNATTTLSSKILAALFILHYFQRSFIYSALIKGGKKTPFVPFFLAFIFCTYNGYMQARSLLKFRGSEPNLTTPLFLTGVGLFFVGMFINIHSDHVLRNLRSDGSKDYKVPRGGMFDYVTAANYFGELVEWTGFAMAAANLQGWAFALFTFSNLVPRALTHHEWYLRQFGRQYPADRYAIIPYLI